MGGPDFRLGRGRGCGGGNRRGGPHLLAVAPAGHNRGDDLGVVAGRVGAVPPRWGNRTGKVYAGGCTGGAGGYAAGLRTPPVAGDVRAAVPSAQSRPVQLRRGLRHKRAHGGQCGTVLRTFELVVAL